MDIRQLRYFLAVVKLESLDCRQSRSEQPSAASHWAADQKTRGDAWLEIADETFAWDETDAIW